ncbi:MAG: hypothetical protein ABL957_02695 [Parvularculaceae bacterium]
MKKTDVISGLLHQGENILWIGQPGFSLAPSPSERVKLLTLVFLFGALMLVVAAHNRFQGSPFVLAFVVALLGAAGAAHLLALFHSLGRRSSMVYCLTNERAIIVEGHNPKSRAWLRISYDTPVAVSERGAGRGHIAFGRKYDFDTEEWPIFRGFAFYDIKDIKRVVHLIERLQDGMAPPGVIPGVKAMAEGEDFGGPPPRNAD